MEQHLVDLGQLRGALKHFVPPHAQFFQLRLELLQRFLVLISWPPAKHLILSQSVFLDGIVPLVFGRLPVDVSGLRKLDEAHEKNLWVIIFLEHRLQLVSVLVALLLLRC